MSQTSASAPTGAATTSTHGGAPVPSDEQASPEALALRAWVGEFRDLAAAASLLGWDQQVNMPPRAAPGRGRSMAALSSVLHARRTSDELDGLISRLEDAEPGSSEAAIWRRSYDLATKLPDELVREASEAQSAGFGAWQEARENDDFDAFLPHLDKLVDIARREAECYGYEVEPYDALHDLYEEGSRAAMVAPMFEQLREPIQELVDRQPEADTSILERSWDIERQKAFGREVVDHMGFDFAAGRIDRAVHPFCSGIGTFDTRLTTRYDENWLPMSLFGLIHEAGHGIYDQSFDRLGLPVTIASAPGLGMHESQSRMYENVIGRSRPFWEHWFDRLCEVFPEATEGVDIDAFVAQVNSSRRSLIRVEADELTYNLHLGMRFELERALVNGDLAPRELPEAWNEASHRWLGIMPGSNAEGCLQDVHWSGGSFGYFPTYTLGNVYAAQFVEAARGDIPHWDELLAKGDLGPIIAWFDEHVYRHGDVYTGVQLVERVSGGPVDVQPLLRYLTDRFDPAR